MGLVVPGFANEDKVAKDIKLHAQGCPALTETSCLDIHSYSANMFWVPTLLPSALIDAGNTKNAQMNTQRGRKNECVNNELKDTEVKTTIRMCMILLFRLCTEEHGKICPEQVPAELWECLKAGRKKGCSRHGNCMCKPWNTREHYTRPNCEKSKVDSLGLQMKDRGARSKPVFAG